MPAEIVSLSARRRARQEAKVCDTLGLTPQERALAHSLVSDNEFDQFIFNDELIDTRKLDDDTFPTHPWTGE